MLQVVSRNCAGLTERRKNQRLDIRIKAGIKFKDGFEYQGLTKNISYQGAFLQLDSPMIFNEGDYCVLTLHHRNGHTEEALTLSCKIIQYRHQGVALQFKSICEDDYNKLVLLLAEFFPESDDLLAEMDNDMLLAWVRSSY